LVVNGAAVVVEDFIVIATNIAVPDDVIAGNLG
jgi:hypothetical protein